MQKWDLGEYSIHCGIVQFSTTARLEAPLSGDKRLLQQQIHNMSFMSGGTEFDAGLTTAYLELKRNRPNAKKVIIFQTDGGGSSREANSNN